MINNLNNESFIQNVSNIMPKDSEPTLEFEKKYEEYQQRTISRINKKKNKSGAVFSY